MQLQYTDAVFQSNHNFFKSKLGKFKKNFNNNQDWIKKCGSIPIIKFNDVLIVGAGASLDNDLSFIRHHRAGFTIISADMALKSLLTNDIIPEIVVSAEIHTTDYFGGLDTSKINLMAWACIANHNLRLWKGRIGFFNCVGDTEEIKAEGLMMLRSGGNVVTLALYYAISCGAQRVFLSGVDLGYVHQYYCRGSKKHDNFNADRLHTIEGREKGFTRPGIDKGNYKTNASFLLAKKWAQQYLKDKDNVYCLSPFGISNINKLEHNNGYNQDRGTGLPG